MASRLTAGWREFLSLLISHRVKYLLIAAHAIAVHGKARMTDDLDVFVEASLANARRIRRTLKALGFGSVAPKTVELAAEGKVFMLGEKPYRIDILTKISGVSFEEAYEARVCVESEAGVLDVIGREHLIRNKRAAGRKKDLLELALLGEKASRTKPRSKSKVRAKTRKTRE